MTEKEQKQAAKHFAEFWKDKGYEKGQSQTFWLQFHLHFFRLLCDSNLFLIYLYFLYILFY